MNAAPIATIAPNATRLRRPSIEPPYVAGAAFLVLEAVLLVVVAVPVLELLTLLETRAVSVASSTNEPVTPLVFVQELGMFELTPETNFTAAHLTWLATNALE